MSQRLTVSHCEARRYGVLAQDGLMNCGRTGMSKCVVCGMPTTQPPVCWDLLCEMELNRCADELENENA